jgi:transposase
MSEKSKPKTYTAEFKVSAVKLAVESGRPMSQTAKELGLSKDTLYGWVRQSQGTRPSGPEPAVNAEHLYEELKRLRRENAILREERDILKKATAYFAKGAR